MRVSITESGRPVTVYAPRPDFDDPERLPDEGPVDPATFLRNDSGPDLDELCYLGGTIPNIPLGVTDLLEVVADAQVRSYHQAMEYFEAHPSETVWANQFFTFTRDVPL